MSKNKEYADKYAGYAMEQMRKYGIPASVTLAQGILESSNGESQLARKENNHFGIKATEEWVADGGRYGLYTDDRPDEKFCSYDTIGESYEHHSIFLKENKRYSECFKLSPDDYKGWTKGLETAGYATGGNYAANLNRIIEVNELDKYDRMVMEEMRSKGKEQGMQSVEGKVKNTDNTAYCFPVEREEFMLVTSPYGMRQDPMDATKQQMHRGIDIQTRHEAVLATEDNGRVVAVNQGHDMREGRSVTVEYQREDNSRIQVSFHHLSGVDVKVGDTVQAGQQLGMVGYAGMQGADGKLHIEVRMSTAKGTMRDMDPAAYLAEIAEKGDIDIRALHNGEDILAKFRDAEDREETMTAIALPPDEWMKRLLATEDSGIGLGGDPIVELMTTVFTSLMALALQIDEREDSRKEQMQKATEACMKREVDLTSLVPTMRECKLTIQEDRRPLLVMDNGKELFSHELTDGELNRLQRTLTDSSLTEEDKRTRVVALVNNVVIAQQVSRNFELGMDAQERQSENRQIR